jgi:P4 family phage/plasmid primase-like protien
MDNIFQDIIDNNGQLPPQENVYESIAENLPQEKSSTTDKTKTALDTLIAVQANIDTQLTELFKQGGAQNALLIAELKNRRKGISKHVSTLIRATAKECKNEKEDLKAKLVYQWPPFFEKKEGWEEPLTIDDDIANGYRVAIHYKDDLLFEETLGWLMWKTSHWAKLTAKDAPMNKVQPIQKMIRKEIQYHDEQGQSCYVDLESEIIRDGLREVSATMGSVSKLRDSLASSKQWLSVGKEDLEKNDMLFVCKDVTLELGTGRAREHKREDYCLNSSPCTLGILHDEEIPNNDIWDGWVLCPKWMRFLDETFKGDSELIAYMQRLCGYLLTGTTREHKIFFLFGAGRNGKSVFMNVMRYIMGEYARACPRNLLVNGNPKEKNNSLSVVFDKRLLVDSELGENSVLDTNIVKALTGSDKLDARGVYQTNIEYVPKYKIVCCTNNKPKVSGSDYAIWQRIRLIPFDNIVPDELQNKNLEVELLMEADEILQWAAIGAKKWNANGLGRCVAVDAATTEYQEDEDNISQFLSNCIIPGDHDDNVLNKTLYERYASFAKENGLDSKDNSSFHKDFEKAMKTHRSLQKCIKYKNNRFRAYRGIRLVQHRPMETAEITALDIIK